MKTRDNQCIRKTVSNQKSKKHCVAFFERGSWYHRIKTLDENGNIKYGKIGGFDSKRDAEENYWRCLGEFEKARLSANDEPKNILFSDYLKIWFENDFSSRIKNTTRMVTAHILYDVILPNVKSDIKLSYIDVDYLDALLFECSKSSPSAGNKSREVLNIAIKSAVIGGYIDNNPMLLTKPYKRKKPNITIYDKTQIKKFLSVAQNSPWYFEILLALFCGLRKGEIYGLKFGDFNVEDKTVKISRQVVANPIIEPNSGSKISKNELIERLPKTPNSVRKLKVAEIIFEELEKRRHLIMHNKLKFGDKYFDNDYICCQENGLPRSLSALNGALTKICKKAGLPTVTVHGLRHIYATLLLENGASLSKISAVLGHSSINTTFEYYCDISDEGYNIKAFMDDNFVPTGAA